MANPNFGSILDRPVSETERPKPLPQGSYTCVVKGRHRADKSAKKQTPFVEFILQPIAAGEDVDPDDLKAWSEKADGTKRRINDAQIKATYYTTEDAMWRLKKFLEDLGVEFGDDTSYAQALDECPGKQIGAHIKHRASQDGQSVFAELDSTFVVE